MLVRTFSAKKRQRRGFLLPSAVVLLLTGIVTVCVQCWWLFVFVDAMFFESSSKRERSRKHHNTSSNEYGYNNDGETSAGSDSRRPSFTIPIVKVDRTKSLETASLGGYSRVVLPKMDEIPESLVAVDV